MRRLLLALLILLCFISFAYSCNPSEDNYLDCKDEITAEDVVNNPNLLKDDPTLANLLSDTQLAEVAKADPQILSELDDVSLTALVWEDIDVFYGLDDIDLASLFENNPSFQIEYLDTVSGISSTNAVNADVTSVDEVRTCFGEKLTCIDNEDLKSSELGDEITFPSSESSADVLIDGTAVSDGASISVKEVDNPNWEEDANEIIKAKETELGRELTAVEIDDIQTNAKITTLFRVDGGIINPSEIPSSSEGVPIQFSKGTIVETKLFSSGTCKTPGKSECWLTTQSEGKVLIEGSFGFNGPFGTYLESEGGVELSRYGYTIKSGSSVTESDVTILPDGSKKLVPLVKYNIPSNSEGLSRIFGEDIGALNNLVGYYPNVKIFKSNTESGFVATFFDGGPEVMNVNVANLKEDQKIFLGSADNIDDISMTNYVVIEDMFGSIKSTKPGVVFEDSTLIVNRLELEGEAYVENAFVIASINHQLSKNYDHVETIWGCSVKEFGGTCKIGKNQYTKVERGDEVWWLARDGEEFPGSGPDVGGRKYNGLWVDANRQACTDQSKPCSYSINIEYFDIQGQDLTQYGDSIVAKADYVLPDPVWKFRNTKEEDTIYLNGAKYTAEACPGSIGGMCFRYNDDELYGSDGKNYNSQGIWWNKNTNEPCTSANNAPSGCYSDNIAYFDNPGSPNREYASAESVVDIYKSISLEGDYNYPDLTKTANFMYIEGSKTEIFIDEKTGREYVIFVKENGGRVEYDVVEKNGQTFLVYNNADGSKEYFIGSQRYALDGDGNFIEDGESTVIGQSGVSAGTTTYLASLGLGGETVTSTKSSVVVRNILGSGVDKGFAGISSPYGQRWGRLHDGTDFLTPTGTPIYAPSDVKITTVDYESGGAGRYVKAEFIAKSGEKVEFTLMHLSRADVKTGETIPKGTVLALTGNTGGSTGPHLHYRCRINGNSVDPMKNAICFNG